MNRRGNCACSRDGAGTAAPQFRDVGGKSPGENASKKRTDLPKPLLRPVPLLSAAAIGRAVFAGQRRLAGESALAALLLRAPRLRRGAAPPAVVHSARRV